MQFKGDKNALSSVEPRVFVDTISSEEANRARAFVIRRGGEGWAPHIKGLGMLVVLLRGVNLGFWSHLRCSGLVLLAVKISFRVARTKI